MKKEDMQIKKKKESALKISIKEGSATSFSTGISNSYITPFALKLSSKEINIGLLSAFTGLISPLAQLFGSRLMDSHARKKIVRVAVFWQAVMWLPLTVLAVLKYYNLFQSSLIYLLIIFYSIIVALGGIAFPPWFSWMGDLVSNNNRGKYFAKRNIVTGISELIAVILGALILYLLENTFFILFGFGLLFTVSFISRLISFSILYRQYSRYPTNVKRYAHSIKTIFKENKNFRSFAYYQLFLNFAIFFASPFFAVYMLSELKFNYFTYMFVSLSGSLFYLLFSSFIGKFSDKYGNVKLLVIENIFFALNPLLWIFIKSPILLFFIPGVVTGIANAAAILSFNNFSYDYLTKKERGIGIAYANIFAGIGIFAGSIIGGLLLNYNVKIGMMNKFIFIFLIAFIVRALVAIIFLPKIKEKKKVTKMPSMHLSFIHPFKSISSEIGWVRHVFK